MSGDAGGVFEGAPGLDGVDGVTGNSKTGKSTDVGGGFEPAPAPEGEEDDDPFLETFTNEDMDDDLGVNHSSEITEHHIVPAKGPFH